MLDFCSPWLLMPSIVMLLLRVAKVCAVDAPAVTASAVQPRQNGAASTNLIGYSSSNGEWYPQGCVDGSTITLSSSFGACAPLGATSFGIATTCLNNDLILETTSYPCGRNLCYTISLFDNVSEQSHHDFFACDTAKRDVTVYRKTPEAIEASTTSGTTSGTTSTALTFPPKVTALLSNPTFDTPLPTQAGGETPGSPSISGISSGSNTSSGPSRSPSQAWIAGAVIGPLVAVVLIGLFAYWLGRRSRKSRPASIHQQQGLHAGYGAPSMASAVPHHPNELQFPTSTQQPLVTGELQGREKYEMG